MDRNRRLDGWFKTFFPLWLSAAKREFNTLMYFDRSLNGPTVGYYFFVLFFRICIIRKKKYVSSWMRAITAVHRAVSASCTVLCRFKRLKVHWILCRTTEPVWPGLPMSYFFFLLFYYLFGLEIVFGEFVTHVNALQTCAHFAETI